MFFESLLSFIINHYGPPTFFLFFCPAPKKVCSSLICKISSTCFGQSFAHHQERKTEIFTVYDILLLWWAGRQRAAALQRFRSPSPCPPQQQDTICCKNFSLTLLMMGKILPET